MIDLDSLRDIVIPFFIFIVVIVRLLKDSNIIQVRITVLGGFFKIIIIRGDQEDAQEQEHQPLETQTSLSTWQKPVTWLKKVFRNEAHRQV